jgi:hypothetical protein
MTYNKWSCTLFTGVLLQQGIFKISFQYVLLWMHLITKGLMNATDKIKREEKTARVRLCGICGGQSGTETGISSST